MEKRNIQIDLDTARKWYKGDDKSLRILAKQAFTMEELEESNLPKSWEECKKQILDKNGYLSSRYYKYSHAVDIFEHLLILRDVYRQGWKPDWTDKNQLKEVICFNDNDAKIRYDWFYNSIHLFSFPTEELAKQFLENFKEELEQLKELL